MLVSSYQQTHAKKLNLNPIHFLAGGLVYSEHPGLGLVHVNQFLLHLQFHLTGHLPSVAVNEGREAGKTTKRINIYI